MQITHLQREPINELLHMYRIPHVFADDLLAYGRDEFDETTHTNETLRELSKFNAGDAFAELHGLLFNLWSNNITYPDI